MKGALLTFVLLLSAAQAFAVPDTQRDIMEARRYARRGQPAQAAMIYEQILKRAPDDPDVLGEYSSTLIALRRLPEAEQVLQKLAATYPENDRYPREVERVQRMEGRADVALGTCIAVAVRFPAQVEWARAEIASLASSDTSLVAVATDDLEKAVKENPKRADLRTMLAETAFDAGREDEAIAEAREADAAGSRDGTPLFSLLGRARATGKSEVALKLAEQLRKEHPQAPYTQKLLIVLGDLYAESGEAPRAVDAYRQAAAADPAAPEAVRARLLAGKIEQSDLHDYAAALAEYAALDHESLAAEDRETLRALQADCHLRMGNLAQAGAVFDTLASEGATPEAEERAAYESAELLFYQGKISDASEAYYALTDKFPTGRMVDDALDRIFLIQENEEGGDALLQKFGEAEYRARIGQPDSALAILGAIVSGHPNDAIVDDARFRIGTIFASTGRALEGARALDSLAADLPESKYAPRALRRAGDIWLRSGNAEEALRAYSQLFSQYPQSLEADEVRPAAEELRKKVGS